jgi:cell division septation protein DedD
MAVDRHDAEASREFRLEGIGLLLGGGFLLALLVGAFFLGRWVERSGSPPDITSTDASGPLAQVTNREPDADAGAGLTYFDSLEGGEKEEEPGREMPDRLAMDREPPPAPAEDLPAAPPPPAATGGDWFVQVAAVRDQGSASAMIGKLERQGYNVRLFSEREGQGLLYKVRVGGYAAEQSARDAAERLRSGGYEGVWVTKVE